MRSRFQLSVAICTVLFFASSALAQAKSGLAISNDQPIEISADTLDVHQDEHKAIFTGNVIATQGTTTLRSKTMTAFYNQDDSAASKPAPAADAPPGISRIEAQGGVVFTTPTETAQGDFGVYNAATDSIELSGGNVTLTRDKNVLKGQKLVYNMATGRSVLTAGGAAVGGDGQKSSGRVHGLFVPKSDKPK